MMIHDFGVTAGRVIFLDLPVLFDLDRSPWADPSRPGGCPRPGAASAATSRDGGDRDIRWIGIDPVYVFHVLNAYDDGDTLVMDVIRDAAFDTDPACRSRRSCRSWPAGPSTWRQAGSPSGASTTYRSSSPGSTTPLPGAPTGTATACAWATGPTSPPIGTHRYDLVRDQSTRFDPGQYRFPGEPVFVRAADGRAEDEEWVLSWSTTSAPTPVTWSFSMQAVAAAPGRHRPPTRPGAVRLPRVLAARSTPDRPRR